MKSSRGLDFNLEEIDTSGATLPPLSALEPGVEKDSKNFKENSHPLDSNHDHTIAKKPEHADNASDCDEVNKTEVDNGFSTISREECKKKVTRRGVLRLTTMKLRKRCSAGKEKRGSATQAQNCASRRGGRTQNGACRSIQQKRDKEEIIKSISPDIVSCAQSPIPSTRSRNSAGRVRKLCIVCSSSDSAPSSICSSPSDLNPIDERQSHKLLGRKSQKKQNDLVGDLQICKTPYSNNPEGIPQKKNENEGKSKSIPEEAFNSDQSLVLSTSSETSVGRVGMLCRVDSSSASISSLIGSHSKMDRVIKKNRHKLSAAKNLKQNELKEDLRISKNRYSDNIECVQQKTDKNVERSKSISAETASVPQSPTPSTSSGNSEGITRTFCIVDRTSTFAPFNTCSSSELETCAGRKMLSHEDAPLPSSSTDNCSETAAQLIKMEKHKLRERENRKKEKELMEELRLLIPDISKCRKSTKAEILRFARIYISTLKQNLETYKKNIEDSRNKNKSLEQEHKNLMKRYIPIS